MIIEIRNIKLLLLVWHTNYYYYYFRMQIIV